MTRRHELENYFSKTMKKYVEFIVQHDINKRMDV